MRTIVPEGMASLVEIVVLPNFTRLADSMRTVTMHKIMERNKYPGVSRLEVGSRLGFFVGVGQALRDTRSANAGLRRRAMHPWRPEPSI